MLIFSMGVVCVCIKKSAQQNVCMTIIIHALTTYTTTTERQLHPQTDLRMLDGKTHYKQIRLPFHSAYTQISGRSFVKKKEDIHPFA